MKNILNINDLLSLDNNLSPVKRPVIIKMVTFMIGVACIFFGVQIEAPDYICYLLAVGGLLTSIISLSLIFSNQQEIVNLKTDETLHKHKLYFHSNEESNINELLANGNIKSLLQLATNNGPLLTIIYSSTNKNYYIAQLFKFVPYEYQPYSNPIIYNKTLKNDVSSSNFHT